VAESAFPVFDRNRTNGPKPSLDPNCREGGRVDGMKWFVSLVLAALLMAGCGGDEKSGSDSSESNQTSAETIDFHDTATLDKILAEAIDSDKLQKRGKEGEELYYVRYKQTPYTGWAKRIWYNGLVRGLEQYKDGKKDGLTTRWYENGQKSREGNNKDGKLMTAAYWKPNGEKCPHSNVKNGNGVWIRYYENGQKWREENWKDSKIDGLWTEWHENGQKESEGNYKAGKHDGLFIWWHSNGQKSLEITYRDDKLMTAIAWKPNGEKCPVTNVVDGNGVVVWYSKDGTEALRMTYKDGE
tara:strand:- start:332 stop:1225 length:894 start_codon:yes stop_codon:yes gene_type:complete